MLISEFGPGADDLGGAGQGRELAPAGDVIVVEVGLDDSGDPQAARPGGLEIDVDVTARVDDGRHARVVIGDQGRQVAEATDRELLDSHRWGG